MILRWWDFIDALFDFNYLFIRKFFIKDEQDGKDADLAVDHYYDVEDLIRGLLKFGYNAE